MSWLLFCQIEVILLTVGLVCSFVVSMNYTQKDNSFAKRSAALGEAFKALAKDISEKHENSNTKLLNDLVDAIKQNKKE